MVDQVPQFLVQALAAGGRLEQEGRHPGTPAFRVGMFEQCAPEPTALYRRIDRHAADKAHVTEPQQRDHPHERAVFVFDPCTVRLPAQVACKIGNGADETYAVEQRDRRGEL